MGGEKRSVLWSFFVIVFLTPLRERPEKPLFVCEVGRGMSRMQFAYLKVSSSSEAHSCKSNKRVSRVHEQLHD